jgi:hypothetical protein
VNILFINDVRMTFIVSNAGYNAMFAMLCYHLTYAPIHLSITADLAEEAATPGGLNEQSWKYLQSTEHFKLQHQVGYCYGYDYGDCYGCSCSYGYGLGLYVIVSQRLKSAIVATQ